MFIITIEPPRPTSSPNSLIHTNCYKCELLLQLDELEYKMNCCLQNDFSSYKIRLKCSIDVSYVTGHQKTFPASESSIVNN